MGQKPFSYLLQLEIRRRKLSVRQLGKLVDPVNPERGRRRVQRHLAGTTPSGASRAVYAEVLGAPHLAEESHPAVNSLRALGRAIRLELEKNGA